MPVRYIGRDPVQKGKTLYEICRQLANSGVGRIVYRQKTVDNWPSEKSFVKLTKVIPDKTCLECRKGEAWGVKIFRGANFGEERIGSSHKMDWKLVPKHLEEEFCHITNVSPPPNQPPSHISAPPWMNMLLKKNNNVNVSNVSTEEPVMMPLRVVRVKPRQEAET